MLTHVDAGLTSSQDYGEICDYKYLLHRAALDDKLEAFMVLLYLSEIDSEVNDEGMTPLHMAAAGGSTSIISHLLGKCTIEHEPINRDSCSLLDKQDNKLRTPLIMAVSMGHEEATKFLLYSGANISMQDNTGKTALHYGALKSLVAVEDFISLDLLSVRDKDGRTALHMAASSGNSSMTSKIVDVLKKESRFEEAVNCRDITKKTPLQYAAEQGHIAIVEEFLIRQDCVETENYNSAAELAAAGGHLSTARVFMSGSKKSTGIQMLLAASEAGNLNIVRYLVMEKHVSPSSNWNRRLPICQAAVGGHLEVVWFFLLRDKEAVKQADGDDKTALHCACDGGMREMAEILLLCDADVEAQDCNGETPLHIAARKGGINVINLLLKSKANIHSRSKNEETPLHIAVAHPEAVEALLKAGADPNSVARGGQTPLHCAVRQECWQSVIRLSNHGANPYQLDSEERSPLYYAIANDHLAIVEKFLQAHNASVDLSAMMSWAIKSASFTVFEYLMALVQTTVNNFDEFKANLLHEAAVGGSIEILDLLLRSGVDANLRQNGSSALHLAAQDACVDHVQKLIDFEAKVDARDDENRTPLHYAAETNDYEAVKVLLDAGSEINAQDNDLVTPIYLAAESNCRDVLQVLLQYQHNIDVNIATLSQGWTPLHVCIQKRASSAARMLLIAGANPNLAAHDGRTPLHIAAFEKHPVAVKTLLGYGADPTMTTKKGDTFLHLAVGEFGVRVFKQLLEHGAEKYFNDQGEANATALHRP